MILGWHGPDWFFNVPFCDAHAATVKMYGRRSAQLSSYPVDPDDGDNNYRHVRRTIARSVPKDTLPAPPVRNDLPFL